MEQSAPLSDEGLDVENTKGEKNLDGSNIEKNSSKRERGRQSETPTGDHDAAKDKENIENLILFLFPKYRYSIYFFTMSSFFSKLFSVFLSPNSGVIVVEEAKNVIKKQKLSFQQQEEQPPQPGPDVVVEVESHPSSSQSAVATGKENEEPLKTKKVNLGTSVVQVRYFVFQSL